MSGESGVRSVVGWLVGCFVTTLWEVGGLSRHTFVKVPFESGLVPEGGMKRVQSTGKKSTECTLNCTNIKSVIKAFTESE